MLYLRTGLPGASKTLNTLKEIIHDKHTAGRPIYYNNIKLLMLDFEVCRSFAGWFYGIHFDQVDEKKKKPIQTRLFKIHEQGELASLETFPHLAQLYEAWLENKGDVLLWLYWVRRCYPASKREDLKFFLESAEQDQVTVETLKQFNLDFRHFKHPALWYELPRNSIIIIDECQQTFPPRPVGSKAPQHCTEFETHRHKGWDIHLVTQDAKLLDAHVRRLAGCHIHYFNPFKSKRVTRYQADKVFDPEDFFQKKNTISSVIKRDADFYGLYWSADAHTHKLVLPKKLFFLLILPILIIFLVYYLLSGSWVNTTPESQPVSGQQPSTKQAAVQEPQREYAVNPDQPEQQIKTHASIPGETPIGDLCTELFYAGYQIRIRNGRSTIEHYFTCELPVSEDKNRDDQEFIPPSLTLDGHYLSNLGFSFEYRNRMPVLTYGDTKFLFPRY